MRIRNHRRLPIDISKDQVCAFSSYTGELQKRFHSIGNFSIVLADDHIHTGVYISRLARSKPTWTDDIGYLLHRSLTKHFCTGILLKKLFCNYVYSGVGTLCRKPHTYQKLPGTVIIKRAYSDRVRSLKSFDEPYRKFGFFHLALPKFSRHSHIISRPSPVTLEKAITGILKSSDNSSPVFLQIIAAISVNFFEMTDKFFCL